VATDPKIIEKIRALLETRGRTPEEAAAYVAKANELAEEYGVAMYEVANGGKSKMASDVRETTAMDIFEHGKPQAWRWVVLQAAAQASGVWAVEHTRIELRTSKAGRSSYRRFQTAYFIGLPLDVEIAGYTYQFLVQEIERLAKVHAKPAWDEIRALAVKLGIKVHEAEMDWSYINVHPLKQEASFRKGAAQGIKEALEGHTAERQAAADTSTTALVVDRDAAIRNYIYQKRYGKSFDEMQQEAAERRAQREAAEAEASKDLPAVPPPKVLRWTKTDEKRYQAGLRKEARREQAEHNRYWANVDVKSWSGGREAGRSMKVRPGVEGGE